MLWRGRSTNVSLARQYRNAPKLPEIHRAAP